MRLALILAAGAALAATTASEDYGQWRAHYEAALKAPDGWLSVAGLSWLQEGANSVQLPAGAPQKTIALRLDHGKVSYQGRVLQTDDAEHPDVLKFGDITAMIIARGGKLGIRVRDPHADTRRDFSGCKWFP